MARYERFHQQLDNGKENVWATKQMTAQHKRGLATLKWLPETNGWRGFAITQTIENNLPESEIGLLNFGHAYVGGVSIFPVLDLFEAKSRNSSFNCMAMDINDTVDISLPDNIKMLRLPRNQKLTNDVAQLQVDYSEKDGRYTMHRTFRWDPSRNGSGSCTKAEWDSWQPVIRRIRNAVKSAVLAYERN